MSRQNCYFFVYNDSSKYIINQLHSWHCSSLHLLECLVGIEVKSFDLFLTSDTCIILSIDLCAIKLVLTDNCDFILVESHITAFKLTIDEDRESFWFLEHTLCVFNGLSTLSRIYLDILSQSYGFTIGIGLFLGQTFTLCGSDLSLNAPFDIVCSGLNHDPFTFDFLHGD